MKRMFIVLLCAFLAVMLTGCQAVLGAVARKALEAVITTPKDTEDAADRWIAYEVPSQMTMGAPAPGTGAMKQGGANVGFYLPDDTSYEEYAPLKDLGFVSPKTRPLSTFAADVDTAAYANIRRMILDQTPISPDAVRIEEMINAFSYHDPVPVGDGPIAISAQVAECPWQKSHMLMRVALKAQEIQAANLPPSNLVFLIDTSGSMNSPDKLPLVQRSFSLLIEQMEEKDRVSIVTYAGSAEVVLEGARGDEKAKLLAAIADLTAEGGTAGADGIETAYALAEKYSSPGVNSRVLLATDGDFNIGINSESDLIRLIEAKKDTGIFLTTLGFGMGNLKDNKMQALADHGNGNATYIDTIHQARRSLIEEMGATLVTVAKDVKIQVEFNPDTIEGYRLIGYENRLMNEEDFVDDTKDGGEMGAGHAMVALYELIPAGAGEMMGTDLTYQRGAAVGSTDYATVHVRYKQPTGEKSAEMVHIVGKDAYTETLGNDFALSAAVAAFGQLLSGSKFSGAADEAMILLLLQPMLSEDIGGRIVELSTLVRQSGGLYEVPGKP